MNNLYFDLKGQLNNIKLSESKSLLPLFEAIINSIQAIEESKNKNNGKICIIAVRENRDDIQNKLKFFKSFIIKDNGIGLNSVHFKSFNTAYTTLKQDKGCKGFGRFLWLKSFSDVTIESIYEEKQDFFIRNVTFSQNGIEYTNNKIDNKDIGTVVSLNNCLQIYKEKNSASIEIIAKKIIEHCLVFFLSENCPQIIIKDEEKEIDIKEYFQKIIKPNLKQDNFSINNHNFVLYHLKIKEGIKNELHFCADMHEVISENLKNYIPNLNKKVKVKKNSDFFYIGFLTSKYLDSIVNTTRTNFYFNDNEEQISLFDLTKKDIVKESLIFIKEYLKEYLEEIDKEKHNFIDNYVQQVAPKYKLLLNKKPDIYDKIPAGIEEQELDLLLYKESKNWEIETNEQYKETEKAIKESIKNGTIEYQDIYEKYWRNVTDLSKTSLAEYITRRKTLLNILENILKIRDNGKFLNENFIHSIICPMRVTSEDIAFEEMNLWIIDERLAYHKYLASDKTLKSMSIINSNSKKEPDIAIFNTALAYTEGNAPFSSVSIIEFKKPDNDKKNPINQVLNYVNLIRNGKKKKVKGQSFIVNEGTIFRCYIICDLTDNIRMFCRDSNLYQTPDNLGYYGHNEPSHASIEVISYEKLLLDAQKRNQILFDKLFSLKYPIKKNW